MKNHDKLTIYPKLNVFVVKVGTYWCM